MRVKLRDVLLMFIDLTLVFFSFNLCYYYCRLYLFSPWRFYLQSTVSLIIIYFVTFFIFGVYRSLWRYAEAREFFMCNVSALTAGAVFFIFSRIAFSYKVPFYFYMMISAIAGLFLVSFRLIYRLYREMVTGTKRYGGNLPKKRTLIVGCGDACYGLLSEIKLTRDCDIYPVVGVDDDENKLRKKFNNLYIAGKLKDIPEVCKKYDAEQIIIAIPSLDNVKRAELIELCSRTGAMVRILPRMLDFEAENRNFLNKIRDITPDELLGREPVNILNKDVLSFICGKTVLVTGGGGSIGSELSRQVAANSPARLIIVDIYENNAYDIEQELIRKYGDSLELKVIISSVRDRERMENIMRTYHPDIVIHAAAHKHVPLMETSPAEAVKNNVFGTLNTALAARDNGVERFIMISTDKAVNPTNIMGATKRVCEMIIQSVNGTTDKTCFSCVRFGNVLGSNGSVIPLFKRQIAEGGPVTVTHPDIIRYFMTIPEAVQLVLITGAMADGGEIFILDMGAPVKILDLAKKMISIAGKKTDIKFIGLRPGEKLYEELLMDEEGIKTTEKDKIHIGRPIEFDSEVLKGQLAELWSIVNDNSLSDAQMMKAVEDMLHKITPTFNRCENKSGALRDAEALTV